MGENVGINISILTHGFPDARNRDVESTKTKRINCFRHSTICFNYQTSICHVTNFVGPIVQTGNRSRIFTRHVILLQELLQRIPFRIHQSRSLGRCLPSSIVNIIQWFVRRPFGVIRVTLLIRVHGGEFEGEFAVFLPPRRDPEVQSAIPSIFLAGVSFFLVFYLLIGIWLWIHFLLFLDQRTTRARWIQVKCLWKSSLKKNLGSHVSIGA